MKTLDVNKLAFNVEYYTEQFSTEVQMDMLHFHKHSNVLYKYECVFRVDMITSQIIEVVWQPTMDQWTSSV